MIREVSLTSRHEVISFITRKEITNSVFGESVEDPMDFITMEKKALVFIQECVWDGVEKIHLYITGLTPATTSFLKSYFDSGCPVLLSLFHFNRDSSRYEEQKIV
jgi:hypothetical protein